MKILKFGGTSLESPSRLGTAADIVVGALREDRVVVVVSAMGGVTDALVAAAERAAHLGAVDELMATVEARHADAVAAVAPDRERDELGDTVRALVGEVRDLLRGVALVHECSPRTRDRILGYGERLSSALVAAALRRRGVSAAPCDAAGLVVTDAAFGAARVDATATRDRIRRHFEHREGTEVVTGFIGATRDGAATTLGRGGSDLTAALLGAALDAACVEIWTDVDGLMSADPRLVPDAFSLPAVTYDELMELSHFGAKIVYPPTVHPARERGIPLVIRNTLNPGFAGTVVSNDAESAGTLIRGISSIRNVALLRLEGDGMVGVPGIAARLFAVLARAEISVILISQASSEHSICFAVPPEAGEAARAGIDREFDLERRAGLIDDVIMEDDLSVIAVVGAGMRERAGIAGRVFRVLGDRAINVRAIAQGSSELSISLVLRSSDEAQAVNAIHDAFFAGETTDA